MRAAWHRRHPLLVVGLAPIAAVLVSVVFNVFRFSLSAVPLAGGLWAASVASLREPMRGRANAGTIGKARARAINLPWHFSAIVALSNLAVMADIHYGMTHCGEPVYQHFTQHLVIAVSSAALITSTIAFFLIEQLVQVLVFPVVYAVYVVLVVFWVRPFGSG